MCHIALSSNQYDRGVHVQGVGFPAKSEKSFVVCRLRVTHKMHDLGLRQWNTQCQAPAFRRPSANSSTCTVPGPCTVPGACTFPGPCAFPSLAGCSAATATSCAADTASTSRAYATHGCICIRCNDASSSRCTGGIHIQRRAVEGGRPRKQDLLRCPDLVRTLVRP